MEIHQIFKHGFNISSKLYHITLYISVLKTFTKVCFVILLYIFVMKNIIQIGCSAEVICHDDVIKWKHFPRYWPFVRGIHRSPMNSAHKGQWRGALVFSLICAWINGWVNNSEAGDLRRHSAQYDGTVMYYDTINLQWARTLGSILSRPLTDCIRRKVGCYG